MCDASDVGYKLLKSMEGENVEEFKFKRSAQCKEFKNGAILTSDVKECKIDPDAIFHRYDLMEVY